MLVSDTIKCDDQGFRFHGIYGNLVQIQWKEIQVSYKRQISNKEIKIKCFLSKGGGEKISFQLREAIISHLQNNSEIAANRLVKNKQGELKPVRYLSDSKIEIYKTFSFKHLVPKSTFFKYLYIATEYKKAQR